MAASAHGPTRHSPQPCLLSDTAGHGVYSSHHQEKARPLMLRKGQQRLGTVTSRDRGDFHPRLCLSGPREQPRALNGRCSGDSSDLSLQLTCSTACTGSLLLPQRLLLGQGSWCREKRKHRLGEDGAAHAHPQGLCAAACDQTSPQSVLLATEQEGGPPFTRSQLSPSAHHGKSCLP